MQSTVCAWGVAILCFVVLMIVTPAIPQSQEYHDFADKRQFFAWKVSFGVGHVFFLGVAAVAFGSGYHHLKPDDARLVWDRLPMTVAFTSLIAIFIIERLMREKAQSTLHLGACLSFNRQELEPLTGITDKIVHTPYRFCSDLRPYALVQFVPCIAIPFMANLLPPMYTHSAYWLWAQDFIF